MRHFYRIHYTSMEIHEQIDLVLAHEVISSLVSTSIPSSQTVGPPRPSDRKNGIFEPTDFWMGH